MKKIARSWMGVMILVHTRRQVYKNLFSSVIWLSGLWCVAICPPSEVQLRLNPHDMVNVGIMEVTIPKANT